MTETMKRSKRSCTLVYQLSSFELWPQQHFEAGVQEKLPGYLGLCPGAQRLQAPALIHFLPVSDKITLS